MQLINDSKTLDCILQNVRASQNSIGLIPTMGNLHAGHLDLVEAARQQCKFVIATIFINPLQFGANEDLERYPRTLDEDIEKLKIAGCDAVFIPSVAAIYPNGIVEQTLVTVPSLSSLHCGASRPKHFDGVCTVVTKLFNLVKPDVSFFGKKDFQQLQIIKKMTSDLCLSIKIIGVDIHRDKTGLALSSRNNYLNDKEKIMSANLYDILKKTRHKILHSQSDDYKSLELSAAKEIENKGLKVEYFSICDAHTLQPATHSNPELVILAAVIVESSAHQTRLIDNITVNIADSI